MTAKKMYQILYIKNKKALPEKAGQGFFVLLL